jgi:superfamily II DNA/RNA helicase
VAQDDRELDRSAPGAGAPGAATTGAAGTAEGEGAATRSQHVVLTLPYDWGLIPQFLRGPLERLDRQGTTAAPGPQLLVVTPDAETAIAVADAALVGRAGEAPFVLPVTRPERAARQLAARPAAAVAGTPAALAALVRGASLKLGGLRTLVLAWADETLAQPGAAAELEVLLAEVPRDVARLLVAAALTDDVAALVERTMFRARRVDAQPRAGAEPVAVSYVAAAPAARADALRRVLDELDPVTAAVVVGTDAGEAEARRALRALGYAGDGAAAGAPGASAAR